MDELLRLWEKLEPDRCRYVRGMSAQVRIGKTAYNITTTSVSLDGLAIIQAAAQKAIAEKGWGWTKDYAKRNDVTVMVYGRREGWTSPELFRCTGHGTATCSNSGSGSRRNANLGDGY